MQHEQKKRVFAKFLAGISNQQENNSLLETPEVRSMMQQQWDSPINHDEGIPEPNLHRILAGVYKRLALGRKREDQKPLIRLFVQRIAAAAAIVIFLVSIGFVFWNTGVIPGKDLVTVNAPDGVRAEVFLPDGSRVWLNAGSTLAYNRKFDGENRELTLEGEAYFNISHNPTRPMVVKTKTADIEVLGTRFNLVSIPSEQKWEATLISGSIRVCPSKNSRTRNFAISPGNRAIWNKENNTFSIKSANTINTTRWVNNPLYFENETLENIARQLEQMFGIEVVVPSDLANVIRFTAKFTDESVYEIFNLLKITAPIDFSVQGNRVYVFTVPNDK